MRARGRWVAFAGISLLSAIVTLAAAQKEPKGGSPKRPGKPAVVAKPDAEVGGADAGIAPMAGRAESATAGVAAPKDKDKDRDAGAAIETKTLDGGARAFRFGEVEIEGRLRSPQLVYFLRRVRAEFAAGDLGHRTFMRELSETRKDPAF
jgi:hypothetical protein